MKNLLKFLPLFLTASSIHAQEIKAASLSDVDAFQSHEVHWQAQKEQFVAYNSCTGEQLESVLPKLIAVIPSSTAELSNLKDFSIKIGNSTVTATVSSDGRYFYENLVGEPKEYHLFETKKFERYGGGFSIETYPNVFFYGDPEKVNEVRVNLYYKNGDMLSLYTKGLPKGAAFSEMFDDIPVYEFKAKVEEGVIKSKMTSSQTGSVKISYQYSFGKELKSEEIIVDNDVAKGWFEFPVKMLKGYHPDTLTRLVVRYSDANSNSNEIKTPISSSSVELFDVSKMWFYGGMNQGSTCE